MSQTSNVIPITKKIVRVAVQSTGEVKQTTYQTIHEKLKRPADLAGYTYKLKSPLTKSGSMYITINHMILNEGTDREQLWPWEIFLNGKDADSYQWVVALMLVISAVFRKGGDVTFIVDELKSVFDPNGGYLSSKGYIPSLVAEIGLKIEEDFKRVGLLEDDVAHKEILATKKADFEKAGGTMDNASECPQCKMKALVSASGCPTCLQCGYSKCS